MKTIQWLAYAIIAFSFAISIFSCAGGSSSGNPYSIDSSVMPDTNTGVAPDTAVMAPPPITGSNDTSKENHHHFPFDTIAYLLPQTPQLQKGSVAYYCPTKMIKNNEYFVTVSISKEQLKQLVAQVARTAAANNPAPINMQDVKGDSILISDRMQVDLVCSDDYFKKVAFPANKDQSFGDDSTLEWDWIIEPTQVKKNILIQIVISRYDLKSDKWVALRPNKVFPVEVQVDARNFWEKSITFLADNPGFLIAQIAIPIITFLAGLFVAKRNKTK